MLLVIVSVVTHLAWFNPLNVLTYGDWQYSFDELTKQLSYSNGAWLGYLDFGFANIQITFYLFKIIWSTATNLGLTYDQVAKITFFIPIAILGYISPYVLFRKLLDDDWSSFVVALFYGSTTFFLLKQTSHLQIALVYAFAPIVLYLFIRALEKNRTKDWMVFVLVFWISICYEVRISYIVLFILVCYFLINHLRDLKRYWRHLIVSGTILIGLNAFWLLPTLLGGIGADILSIAKRGLFGDWLFDMSHAMTLFSARWTGARVYRAFISYPVPWYFWIIPAIVFIPLIYKKHSNRRLIFFFSIIALVGIFLSKQSAEPFPSVYGWLYNNIPTFNLYREASKFYLLTAIGYAGLLGFSLRIIKQKIFASRPYVFVIVSMVVILLSLWNTKPILTRQTDALSVPRQVPRDYKILKDFLIEQDEYFRTLWIPQPSRWGFYSNEHPKISIANVNQSLWSDYIGDRSISHDLKVPGNIVSVLKRSYSDKLLDDSSIKYVIVPIRDEVNNDDFYPSYGNNPKLFIEALDKLNYLKRIDIGSKDLAIWENEDYEPHIKGDELSFQAINSTKYGITVNRLDEREELIFSERFHPGWKLYLRPVDSKKPSIVAREYSKAKTVEYKAVNQLLEGEELSYLTKQPIFEDSHKTANIFVNQWKLDPEYIKRNFSEEFYKENPDGSIDINIVLFFKPQSYFYLGIAISLVALLCCLVMLTGMLKHDRVKAIFPKRANN